jgi:hypothetical protein
VVVPASQKQRIIIKKEEETRHTALHEDADSAVDQDALLHGEALLVVASSDAEDVTLVFLSEQFAIDIGAHTSVEEVAAL